MTKQEEDRINEEVKKLAEYMKWLERERLKSVTKIKILRKKAPQ